MGTRTINFNNWPRKDTFEFFNSYQDPQFNICANVTITKTYKVVQAQGISRFLAILWLISDAANSVSEIRYRIRGNSVVEHKWVHPSFTWLNQDNTLTFCQAQYRGDVSDFFERAEASIAGVEPNPMVADQQGGDDVLYVSCVPWVNFTSISHPYKMDDTRSIPRITWGKFFQEHDQWLMPVSIQLHHGLADGYHAGLFFDLLQDRLNQPEKTEWPL